MTDAQKMTLKVAAILWIIWGLVHTFAGVMVLANDSTGGFQAIADAVDPAALEANYNAAVGGILNQHGWNLGWFGVATIVGAILIWRQNITAIWVTGMIGGLADLGYLFRGFPRLCELRARYRHDVHFRCGHCPELLGLVFRKARSFLSNVMGRRTFCDTG